MADKNLLSQMLEHLVNDDQAKAEELFHEYVVSASREIYESLIESEIEDEEDEEVEEAAEVDAEDEEQVEEDFEDIAFEGDDEDEGDATDDLLGDIEVDGEEEGEGEEGEEGEEGPESLEDKVMDLEDAVEELEAKFAELQAGEEQEPEHADMFGGEEEGKGQEDVVDSFDQELATVREYVEKVTGGHGAEKKGAGETQVNAKSPLAGKNDMGGTTANIAKGGEGGGTDKGLLNPSTKDLGVNDPKAAAKGAFKSKVANGHGAEKAGSKESADNKQSLFRK